MRAADRSENFFLCKSSSLIRYENNDKNYKKSGRDEMETVFCKTKDDPSENLKL